MVSFARDAGLCFVYNSTLVRLYALTHKVCFFSLLDNEAPENGTDVLVLPGGYPELYASKVAKATKLLVFLSNASAAVYAECGGYIALARLILSARRARRLLGALNAINCAVSLTLAVYRYCVLVGDKRGVFAGHEFHCYVELSKVAQNCVYLIKLFDELKLGGLYATGAFGGYTHFVGSIR